jgi:dolichol-phosphate mannosyltransferase
VSSFDLPSFAVVIPAYNEEAGIRAVVEAVDEALDRLSNRTAIVVVDDGSSDGTADELAQLAQTHPRVMGLMHPQNRGYGAALRTGTFFAADRNFHYVLFMDSDLTNDPKYLREFAERMRQGFEVIKASRYVEGGGADGVPRGHAWLSRLGNDVARLLFRLPLHDCTNGFRAVRTGLLISIDLQENGFALIMEELYRLRPLTQRYAEVPILLTTRPVGLRPSSFSFGPIMMAKYLKYPLLSVLRRGRA